MASPAHFSHRGWAELNPVQTNEAQPSVTQPPGAPRSLRLELTVREPEVDLGLQQCEDGPSREAFALSAPRLGDQIGRAHV